MKYWRMMMIFENAPPVVMGREENPRARLVGWYIYSGDVDRRERLGDELHDRVTGHLLRQSGIVGEDALSEYLRLAGAYEEDLIRRGG